MLNQQRWRPLLESAKPAVLDTVHFHSNSAVNGGAIYLNPAMDLTVDDLSNWRSEQPCLRAVLL